MFSFCHVHYGSSLMYFQGEIGGEEDQEVQQMDLLLGQIGNLIDLLKMAGSLLAAGSWLVAWKWVIFRYVSNNKQGLQ